ncbi:MAG TPA: sulfotransferase [Solirubrobacterales bacterium]
MPLPTFFIIGAPKAGTTSLHHYLDQHPQVQMSSIKEPRFFAGPENGIPYPPDRVDNLQEYEQLFDPTIEVRGESSTDYAIHPRRQNVPERIKGLVPKAKFIYLVRDPVARTISHYKMRAALMGERRSLNEALSDLSDLHSPYVFPSLYASQLKEYLRHFPQERVLVIDQADLLQDRRPTLRRAFSFLAVDSEIDSLQFEEELLNSQAWRTYPSGYANFIARVVAPTVRWIPRDFRRSVRRSVERRLWPPLDTTLDDKLRARLEELYEPEVAHLRALTGEAFATWSI